MKAHLDADGTLYVEAETELEAYALNQWGKENYKASARSFKADNLEILWDVTKLPEPAPA